jgi:hypothetical protein
VVATRTLNRREYHRIGRYPDPSRNRVASIGQTRIP